LIRKVISKPYFVVIIGIIIIFLSFVDNIVGISFLSSYDIRSSSTVLGFLTFIFLINTIGQIILVSHIIKEGFLIPALKLRKKFRILSNSAIIISLGINFLVFSSLLISSYQNNSYNLSQFVFLVFYNLIASVIVMGILAYKFLTWLIGNKNLAVFLYMFACLIFLLVIISLINWLSIQLEGKPEIVSPDPNPWDNSSSRINVYFNIYRISSLIMFGFFWIATAMLLKSYISNHAKQMSKKKYWILVVSPLVYYIISSDFVLNQFNSIIFQYPFMSNFIIYAFGAAKQVGGIFFSIIFLLISKGLPSGNLKNSLILSSIGIMMLFSSIQVSILSIIPYPLFGLNTLLIMPLSSYLLLIGLYYSAQSVAFDKQFLKLLKRNIKDKSSMFLESIGSAQWKKNMENVVEGVMKSDELVENKSYSELSTEDINKQIQEIMKEIRESKESQQNKEKR
jgi:hypothetical protein